MSFRVSSVSLLVLIWSLFVCGSILRSTSCRVKPKVVRIGVREGPANKLAYDISMRGTGSDKLIGLPLHAKTSAAITNTKTIMCFPFWQLWLSTWWNAGWLFKFQRKSGQAQRQ